MAVEVRMVVRLQTYLVDPGLHLRQELLHALAADALQRDHLRGVALDVYVGEFEHTPLARLWSDPRMLITPHVSGASDADRHGVVDLFCDNLRAYLDGRPLRNVIDWEQGY